MEYSNSDPGSFTPSLYFPETTSSSSQRSASLSDEELLLASSHPKKRAGRKKFKETRHPVYRGVRQRNADKWVCELREPTEQKRIWLGTYPTAEMAARAHDVAAIALRGSAACLNFADSVWRLPVPASRDAKDLRKAAAEAAEAFRPRAEGEAYVERRIEEERVSSYDEEKGGFPELYNVVYEDMSMAAEGVMLSPPPQPQVGWSFGWDEVESEAEVELWSF